jgi:hypothetical protein
VAAELHVLSGERAGLVIALSGAECTVGRHPGSTLCFGAGAERGVSARHATLVPDGAGWLLRDLGSTNGTWLNRRRLSGDAPLRDGDRIVLGAAGGPVVEFRDPDAPASSASVAPRRARRAGLRALPAAAAAFALLAACAGTWLLARRPAAAPPGPDAGIRVELARREIATPVELDVRETAAPADAPPAPFRDSPAPPPPRPSSVARTPAARPGPRARVRDTGARVPSPPAGRPLAVVAPPAPPPAIAPATVALPAPAAAAAPSTAPAAVPPPVAQAPRTVTLERRNRLALARIYVEGEDGEVATGTAFAVRSDATLITSRHVVGGRPRRIAVQFVGSTQVWRARVVAVSGEWDLAAVKVDSIAGSVPTVLGLNLRADTLAAGTPVMLAGFPRGGEPEGGTLPRPALVPAAFAAVRGGRVELHARSAAGASGSPVFDADGRVVAILFGGNPRAEPPVLYAVPASAIAALLEGT